MQKYRLKKTLYNYIMTSDIIYWKSRQNLTCTDLFIKEQLIINYIRRKKANECKKLINNYLDLSKYALDKGK
jgi:hypothetical protein